MKKCVFMMAGVFYSILSCSQTQFNNRYNLDFNDGAIGIQHVFNNYLITSTTFDNDSNIVRVQTIKIDSSGNILNNFSFFQPHYFYYGSWYGGLIKNNESEFVFHGTIIDSTGDDAILFILNDVGDSMWTKRFVDTNFTIGRNLCLAYDTGFILIGQSDPFSITNPDIFMRKTDSLGNVQWQRTFDNSLYDDAFSVIRTKDNCYLIGGYTRNNGSTFGDGLVIKTDSAGNEKWRRVVGDQYTQSVWDVVETQDSNYVVTGSWQVNNVHVSCCDPYYRFFIMKLDKGSGNIIWNKLYDDTIRGKSFHSIIELDDGSLVCAGAKEIIITSSQIPYYGTIFKFSANGDSLWERNYLAPNVVNGWSVLNDIISTSDGGFIAVGETGGDGLTQDTWILKVDSEGCEVSNCLVTGYENRVTEKEQSISIYPNPVTGNSAILKFANAINEKCTMEIYDVEGRLIHRSELPEGIKEKKIDTIQFASGLYYIRFLSSEFQLNSKFLVIGNSSY